MLLFIFPTSYPNSENEVANSFIKEQLVFLARNKDVKIVVLNVQKQPSKHIFKTSNKTVSIDIEETGPVLRTQSKTFLERKIPNINQLAFNSAMKRLYSSAVEKFGEPDCIYAHFYRGALAAIRATEKENIPIVVMEHSGELMNKCISRKERRVLREVVKTSDAYIATTDSLKKNILAHTGLNRDIRVIPNVIDEHFSYSERKDESFTFLAVSRLTYDKRLDLLIDAFIKAFDKNEDVKLRIGGQGPELESLVTKVNQSGRNSQITFLGQLSRIEVVDELKKCSCFALPSRHETFGIVWREALCVGRPVITTDHGGFSNSDWKDSFGVMIPVDNLELLVQALIKIRENYTEYDLKKISDVNRDMYAGTQISKRVLEIINGCIKEKNK